MFSFLSARWIKILRPFEFPGDWSGALRVAISLFTVEFRRAGGGVADSRPGSSITMQKSNQISISPRGVSSQRRSRPSGTPIIFQFTRNGFNYGSDLETSRTCNEEKRDRPRVHVCRVISRRCYGSRGCSVFKQLTCDITVKQCPPCNRPFRNSPSIW